MSIEEIARRLGFTPGTVRTYAKRLYRDFGARTRYQMIANARRAGVVPADGVPAIRPRWLTTMRMRHLMLAHKDLSDAEIARQLHRTQRNVDRVFAYIRQRLDVATTLEAVDAAIELGLLPAREPPRWLRNPLTERECAILDLLARGWTPAQIGRKLNNSGIYQRLRRLRTKLRVHSNDALIEAVDSLDLHRFAHRKPRVRRSAIEQIARHRRPEPLTSREEEVLRALSRWPDETYDEIGERLGVGRGMVTQHVFRLKRYFAVRTKEELIAQAKAKKRRARKV